MKLSGLTLRLAIAAFLVALGGCSSQATTEGDGTAEAAAEDSSESKASGTADAASEAEPDDAKSRAVDNGEPSKAAQPARDDAQGTTEPKSRTFEFAYAAVVKELPAGARVRVWLPVPQDSDEQKVTALAAQVPGQPQYGTEAVYGNRIMYFETEAPASAEIEFKVPYRIERKEVLGLKNKTGAELDEARRKLYLAANARVPVDGKPVELLADIDLPKDNPLTLGKTLYSKVEDHMKYDKSRPGYGNGDSAWACDSRFGNCTDFHSLFISMARSQGVPARFEIGFPLPPQPGQGEIGGYHCWAYFFVDGHGWVPVDISEADKNPDLKDYYFGNLTENRVTFTSGRDIDLVPQQDGEPLNYFVYPYVEVDGTVWPTGKMQKKFRFKDVSG